MLTEQAVRYTLRQLARLAGVDQIAPNGNGFESLGISVYYDRPESTLTERPAIIVVPCDQREAWYSLLNREPHSIDWFPTDQIMPTGYEHNLNSSIPVLFWGQWSQVPRSFVQRRSNGSIIFNADIVAAAFFMLSRWEEAITLDRDQHGRFPSASSVAYKQDFLHRPIVDEYALILRAWLEMLLPRWKPQIPHFRVFLTHDLDHPTRPTSWQKELRYAVGDVLKRHTLSQAMGRLKKMYLIKKDITNDEYFAEFRALMDVSEYYGFKSTFHFMASPGGPFDSGYDLRRLPYRSMVKEVIARGHQVGFHPGYSTYQNPQRFQEEKDRLAEVLGHEDFGGRHHYLRFSVPTTWRLWEESALLYDSTMGYADHNGFRCGTCHPFHPFDLERDREIDILERPLIVMDKILSQYHHHTPEQMIERVLQLARECQRVGGEFVLLWHNSPQDDIRPSGIVYRRIVERLAQVDHQDTAKML